MQELWKDIESYKGKYQISTEGNIKSLNYNNTGKEKLLKPKINKNGYLEIKLSINNKFKDYQVARLVLLTFRNLRLNKNDIILYRDNDKTNCSLNNLYLTTRGKYQEFTYEKGNRKQLYVEYYGNQISIKELSKITNNSQKLLRSRLERGWNSYECEIPKGG